MARSSMRSLLVLATAGALTVSSAPGALAAPGDLDPSFGRGGKVVTDVTRRGDAVNAVTMAPNGGIVVAGTSKDGSRFAVAEYRTDGSLDPTFGDHGVVQTNVTDASDVLRGVAVQPDGAIVVAGQVGTGPRFVVARYTADGSLDPTFGGGDGMVSTRFEAKGGDAAVAVAVLPDGTILASGVAHTLCSCERYAVARYDADGTLDRTFGTSGTATVHFRFGGEPSAMAVGSDGSIVLAGGNVPDVDRLQVARFTADGVLDATFGGDGKVTTNTGQGEEAATAVAIEPDGTTLVAGYTDQPHEAGDTFGPSKFAVVRYRKDGSLDPTFGTKGKVKTSFSAGAMPHGLVVQADGSIVLAGGVGGRFGVVRYAADGTLDPTFGGDGIVTTNLSSDVDEARGVALQTDGRIVAAGTAWGIGRGAFALARYLAA
jgi:uncharacterized delta-60 repeat protein